MAVALARRLESERIHAIYTSDLLRARETGEKLTRLKNLPIRTDQRLREGRWASQEVTGEFPTLPFPVEVEDREQVKARMIEAMTEIAERHEGERVVVVSHAGPVKQFVAHIRQYSSDPLPEFRAVRSAINRLEYSDGIWHCRVLDDADHLQLVGDVARDESSDPLG